MTIKDYEDLIAECKKSLNASQKLFKDVVAVSSMSTGTIIASQDNDERKQKIYYMIIALICSEWESLHSQVYFSDISKYHTFSSKVYKKGIWCTEELKQLGYLRDCIMHHGGEVERYCKWIEKEKKRKIVIDKKYIHPNTQKIFLSDDKYIDEFFRLVIENGLNHVLSRINNHINRNKLELSLWGRFKNVSF